MKPQVYHVDAFTSQPFRGNSAGVVFPADNLSECNQVNHLIPTRVLVKGGEITCKILK